MAPSPKESNLERLLISGIYRPLPSAKHLLMQVSLAAYLEKTKPIDRIEMEYELRYEGDRDLYGTLNNGGGNRISIWPVDLALIYNEGRSRICEFIEVESIKLPGYHRRIEKLWFKARKVDRIVKDRYLNGILDGVDEVRFSVAMDSNGVSDKRERDLVKKFSHKFRAMQRYGDADNYNIYLLRENRFYTDSNNARTMRGFVARAPQGLPIMKHEYPLLEGELIKAYKGLRRKGNISSFYTTHRF